MHSVLENHKTMSHQYTVNVQRSYTYTQRNCTEPRNERSCETLGGADILVTVSALIGFLPTNYL